MLLAILVTGSTAVAGAPAPEGRTYFVYIMGLNDDPYEVGVDCLAFDATQACSLDDEICLAWERAEGGLQTRKESGFSIVTEIDDDGLILTLEGQGRVNSRGGRSSISVAADVTALDVHLNFVFAGRQVGKNRCLRLQEEFLAAQAAAR